MAQGCAFFCSILFVLLTNHVSLQIYPFQNTTLSWEERVEDLVGRLTLDELMEQMSKGGATKAGGPSPAIERLGIGPYQWNSECLRGDVMAGNATSFPQALGIAASFSTEVIRRVAEAGAVEMRAKHNDYVRHKNYGDHTGLSCFAPVINIFRHPLWGRNQETYGEDPYMSGIFAVAFVSGLQGPNPRYARATSTCKHFDAYGGPENIPSLRLAFDSKVSERDLRLTFLPAFRTCVRGGTYAICCSYNRINGVPACSNKDFLTYILRYEWKFRGYVVSDYNALEYAISYHKYFNNTLDAAAVSVNAGLNLELADYGAGRVYSRIADAVKAGMVEEELVRERVKPLFYTRMRLGEFDPPHMNPYTTLNLSVIQSPEHQDLAVWSAFKTFVLLKKPMAMKQPPIVLGVNERVAVIGPMANNSAELFGDYHPDADEHFVKTPLQGLSELGLDVNYAAGCVDGNKCNNYSSQDVRTAVTGADIVVVCLGTGTEIETEGNDRKTMELPGKQLQLLKDAVQYAKVPVTLILFNAGPVNISWADQEPSVSFILECFFPAQGIGEALKQTLTLKNSTFNPAGRLPFTWPGTADQIPSMTDYSMKGRSYRYFTGTPLYPFGYGLSYSEFEYSQLSFDPTIKAGQSLNVSCVVYNKGPVAGDEVVQLYISWMDTKEDMPHIQLAGFDRVNIKEYQSVTVSFTVGPEWMAVWNDVEGFIIEPGRLQLNVGGQQPNQSKKVPSNVLGGIVTITGTQVLGRH